jgi:hypothetical protein
LKYEGIKNAIEYPPKNLKDPPINDHLQVGTVNVSERAALNFYNTVF